MLRLIVAGSRNFNNYEQLEAALDRLLLNKAPNIVIISGTARGADQLGERYAKEHGYTVEQFPAEWERYGKSAGYRRNEEMARAANALVAFWDGESRGTKHMIDTMQTLGWPVRIVRF